MTFEILLFLQEEVFVDYGLIENTRYMEANVVLDNLLPEYNLSKVEKAKVYMTENFHNNIKLKDIATSANLSMFHFGRIFKKVTRLTPHQYLTGLRLKHAALLLRNSKAQVKEIGYSSGFNNAEHFSSTFKKKYRISPVEFRMSNANSPS